MTNTNIQGNLEINGRGHVNKVNRGYVPGEYRKLVNAEIDSTGRLTHRRPIKCVSATVLDNPYGFIGHWGPWAMVTSIDGMRIFNAASSVSYPLWSPNDQLTTDGNADSWHTVVKFVRYNNINHWITSEYQATTNTYLINLVYSTNDKINPDDATSLASVQDFASTTQVTIVSKLSTSGTLDIRDAFVHKDRLWVVCSDSVYFSKPTDFTEFDAPDGGFFLYPECYLQSGIGNRDSIYLVGNSGVYYITYATDPNVDSVARTITGSGGGDSCCVYEDNVYFTKDDFLYVVMNGSVTKVMDLNLGFYGHSNVYTKVQPFGEYLVMLRWKFNSYGSEVVDNDNEFSRPPKTNATAHPVGDFRYEYNLGAQYYMYFLNMSTGSIHVVDFLDVQENASTYYKGHVSDIYFLPLEDGKNNYHLYMLTKHLHPTDLTIPITGYDGEAHRGSVYEMPLSFSTGTMVGHYGDPVLDSWITDAGIIIDGLPAVDIEIEGYSPDGNEYLLKKFRSIMIQGVAPSAPILELRFGFDNQNYSPAFPLSQNVVEGFTPNEVHPYRFPINQRARSLHINIKTVAHNPVTFTHTGPFLEQTRWSIEDVKVLWGYTQRSPINRTQSTQVLPDQSLS